MYHTTELITDLFLFLLMLVITLSPTFLTNRFLALGTAHGRFITLLFSDPAWDGRILSTVALATFLTTDAKRDMLCRAAMRHLAPAALVV